MNTTNYTHPSSQEITAQLRILKRAQLNYRYAADRDEKNQVDETLLSCTGGNSNERTF